MEDREGSAWRGRASRAATRVWKRKAPDETLAVGTLTEIEDGELWEGRHHRRPELRREAGPQALQQPQPLQAAAVSPTPRKGAI